MHTVTIREHAFGVTLPALDLREDLVYSYGAKWKANKTGLPVQRICAAMLALCIPEVAFGLRTQTNPRADLFEYGAEVWLQLREKGWTAADFLSAGNAVVGILVAETFPRESEVEAARGN